MTASGAKVRAVAAEVVDAVVEGGKSLDAALAGNELRVTEGDCPLLRKICYGSLRHHWQLQSWVNDLISKPLCKRDRVISSLLIVALYQFEKTRIPDHAVVSETVAAARTLKRPKLAGLVNACLRRFKRENLASRAGADRESRWNHPEWFIARLQQDWPEDWQRILSANNERAPMWLRVNAAQFSAGDYLPRLQAVGIEAQPAAGIADAIRLGKPVAVETLPGFANGDVSVQDAAAQIAARWLMRAALTENDKQRVLDACAAPGGKSAHLLEIGAPDLDLVAVDQDETRLASVIENLARIQRDATIIAGDASKPEEWWDGRPFGGILLDAPCSASGVIRRHPDIKMLRRESDLAQLARRQSAILAACWRLLAPGGTLLYVTCSVFSVENDEVIRQFLKDHSDAFENDMLLNNNIHDLMRRKARGYQILPGTAGLDGFYFAALEKKVS